MAREHRSDGVLTLVTGSSRSGKSSAVMLDVQRSLPLLVWDVEGQWSAMRQAHSVTLAQLKAYTLARLFGRYSLTLAPTPANFEAFCLVAFSWAQLVPHATIVVEELADVSRPGKAPAAWGVLVRRALKYGADLYGITNAPSESDTTVIRNAGRKLVFLAEFAADRERMAAALDVELNVVSALIPLHYLYKVRGSPAEPRALSLTDLRKLRLPHTSPAADFL